MDLVDLNQNLIRISFKSNSRDPYGSRGSKSTPNVSNQDPNPRRDPYGSRGSK